MEIEPRGVGNLPRGMHLGGQPGSGELPDNGFRPISRQKMDATSAADCAATRTSLTMILDVLETSGAQISD